MEMSTSFYTLSILLCMINHYVHCINICYYYKVFSFPLVAVKTSAIWRCIIGEWRLFCYIQCVHAEQMRMTWLMTEITTVELCENKFNSIWHLAYQHLDGEKKIYVQNCQIWVLFTLFINAKISIMSCMRYNLSARHRHASQHIKPGQCVTE